ncbi:hypothetical protein HKD37_08G021870 [Glycine soja]
MILSMAKQYHAKAAAEARDGPEGPKPKLGFMPGHSKVEEGMHYEVVFYEDRITRARSLRDIKDDAVKKSTQTSFFKPNHEGVQDSNDELDTMDYTPAKRNPPIHN